MFLIKLLFRELGSNAEWIMLPLEDEVARPRSMRLERKPKKVSMIYSKKKNISFFEKKNPCFFSEKDC